MLSASLFLGWSLKLMVNDHIKHPPKNVHEGNGENELGSLASLVDLSHPKSLLIPILHGQPGGFSRKQNGDTSTVSHLGIFDPSCKLPVAPSH
jgi:hypothetical protein